MDIETALVKMGKILRDMLEVQRQQLEILQRWDLEAKQEAPKEKLKALE